MGWKRFDLGDHKLPNVALDLYHGYCHDIFPHQSRPDWVQAALFVDRAREGKHTTIWVSPKAAEWLDLKLANFVDCERPSDDEAVPLVGFDLSASDIETAWFEPPKVFIISHPVIERALALDFEQELWEVQIEASGAVDTSCQQNL